MSLPPLPEKECLGENDWQEIHGHTAEQMREYGALCRKMALEEAAKFCESQQVNHSPRGGARIFTPFEAEYQGTHEGIFYAKAIRELK